MPRKIKNVSPPKGFARIIWRAPIFLYKIKLGWLLGDRFLLLKHTGRKSGLPRRNVLEVIRHDRESDVYYVASGFGEKSDWFRNVTAHPEVNLQVGGRRLAAQARRLEIDEAENEMASYFQRHPSALNELAKIMGYELDGTEEDARAMGHIIPVVAFTPSSGT